MDKKSVSFLFVGLLCGTLAASIGFAFGLSRSGQSEHHTVLRLAHALPETHPVHAGILHMKERLTELSGGSVELKIIPNGLLGNETACLEQVQKGTLDITKISTAPMEAFVPAMQVFGLPYIFRDHDHYWRTLDGRIGQELLLAGQDKGLRGLCYFDAGTRNFYTTTKPVLSPDDLVGMKIRVQRSDVAMQMISTLGGSPTPIPWNELYTALQQGMVDGAENNPPSYIQSHHYEVAKHFVFNKHTRVPDILVINAERYEALPTEVQTWLTQAAQEASVFQRNLWKTKSKEAIEFAESQGVAIYTPDLDPFIEKVTPMYDAIENESVKITLERIRGVE